MIERFLSWRDRGPLGGLFVFMLVFWVGLQLALQLGGRHGQLATGRIVAVIIGGVFYAGLMTAFLAFRRRRAGGRDLVTAMNRAVRTGHVPETADPAQWMPPLEKRRRSATQRPWAGPVVFGGFGVLCLVLLVTTGPVLLWALFAAFYFGFAAWYPVLMRRQRAKIDRVRAQLTGSATP